MKLSFWYDKVRARIYNIKKECYDKTIMPEQIHKIEKPKEIKPNEEALEKIREIKSSGRFGGIKNDRLFYEIEKELFDPVNKKFGEKYPDVNLDITELPKDWEIALKKQEDEFDKIIKGKSEEEILKRAKKIYEFAIDGKNFNHAYTIAKWYLDQKNVEVAAKKEFKKTVQKMEKSAKEDEKVDAANKILSASSLPEIKRSAEILKEAFGILLRSEWFKERPHALYLKIQNLAENTNQQLPKNKKFFEFVNPFARKWIKKLIKEGNKQRAIDKAEFYEKKGFLDLKSDSDLFEELTK